MLFMRIIIVSLLIALLQRRRFRWRLKQKMQGQKAGDSYGPPLVADYITNPNSIVACWQRYETEVWVDRLNGETTSWPRHSELVGEWTQTPPTRQIQPGLCLGRAFFVSSLGIGAIEQVQSMGASP